MQRFFILSIILNIIFMSMFSFLIYRKGGFVFLYHKIKTLFNGNVYYNNSAYYNQKKSQFEVLDISNVDIIFLGDSITEQGQWMEFFNNPNIKNRGIGGDTTAGIFNRIEPIIKAKPQKIFLMAGVNDLYCERKSIADILKTYKSILNKFKQVTPNTQVFVQSVLPVNNTKENLGDNQIIVKLNIELAKLAQEFNYKYIDVFSHLLNSDNQLADKYSLDGVHLTGEGYLVWKEVIKEYVHSEPSLESRKSEKRSY